MIKMKIRVAKEILTRRSFNQEFSLRVFLIPRNLEKPHTISVRAIVCDSEKSRFDSVRKADLSVREVEDARRLFERLIPVGFHNCELNKK